MSARARYHAGDVLMVLAGLLLAVLVVSLWQLAVYGPAGPPDSFPGVRVTLCQGPALSGHHAVPMLPGESVTGTDGRNGVAPGDTYTCERSGRIRVS